MTSAAEIELLRAALAEAVWERNHKSRQIAELQEELHHLYGIEESKDKAEADLAAMKTYALKLDDWNDKLQAELAAARDALEIRGYRTAGGPEKRISGLPTGLAGHSGGDG